MRISKQQNDFYEKSYSVIIPKSQNTKIGNNFNFLIRNQNMYISIEQNWE